jgi:hypothetical protein
MNKEIHVSKDGNDLNKGTEEFPFLTINKAAQVAEAGATITVHEGTYRERVDPKNGGTSESNRITYQSAPNEQVIIKGSELIKNWVKTQDGLWKATIPNSIFNNFNPYKELIHGDWFQSEGRKHHRGEVYLDGKSLFEAKSLEETRLGTLSSDSRDPNWSKHKWFSEVHESETTLYVNFQNYDPREHCIEINVREFCFWPSKTGRNYITVRGFTMRQAATQWAPPTAEQIGMIGPNWSKGWIIEDNTLSDSKCTAICLGKEKTTGHNEWTELEFKHGTQRERDVVLRALKIGWNKDNIGSHIVRNNTIHDCEQTAICGHLGAIFSTIENNHIHNIYTKRLFKGAEVAGIKFHAPIDTLICNNHIHNTFRGIWMDWQTQGTRISSNLIYDNDCDDLFIEVNHGPYLIDNNILLSDVNFRDMSQGGAYLHNLYYGKNVTTPVHIRFTPYHIPHQTEVMGFMTIQGGDNRFYNNIFINPSPTTEQSENSDKKVEGAFIGKVPDHIPSGTHIYNGYPTKGEKWFEGHKTAQEFNQHTFPIDSHTNLYYNGAKEYEKEQNPIIKENYLPKISVCTEDETVYLQITIDQTIENTPAQLITSQQLGFTIQTESQFENPDGSPLRIDKDARKQSRKSSPTLGPIEALSAGTHRIPLAVPA